MKRVYVHCECGWRGGPYKSTAQAAYAGSRHSCTRHEAAKAALAARIVKNAAVDRIRKPCLHKRTRHSHGTYACYVLDACRCLPCAAANNDYEQTRRRRNAYGRTDLVDAGPVRDHVAALRAAGVGLKQVAKTSGVAHGALSKLVYGGERTRKDGTKAPPSARVRKKTAAAVLAVTAGQARAGGARVDSTGTRRRLQALACLGWTVAQVAARTTVGRQALDGAMHGRPVTTATAHAVAVVYDRLWNQPPPRSTRGEKGAAERAKAYAAARGWVPPLAWDDIDDITEVPIVGERAVRTQRDAQSRRLHVEDVEFLLDHDPTLTAWHVGARLGVTQDGVTTALRRAGRRDLLDRLARATLIAREGVA